MRTCNFSDLWRSNRWQRLIKKKKEKLIYDFFSLSGLKKEKKKKPAACNKNGGHVIKSADSFPVFQRWREAVIITGSSPSPLALDLFSAAVKHDTHAHTHAHTHTHTHTHKQEKLITTSSWLQPLCLLNLNCNSRHKSSACSRSTLNQSLPVCRRFAAK